MLQLEGWGSHVITEPSLADDDDWQIVFCQSTSNALQLKVAVVNTKPSCRNTFSNISKQKNPIAVLKAQEIAFFLVSIKMKRTFRLKKITPDNPTRKIG